ncbi:hypothetical protein ACOMHN_016372 [Nucella lapillus]
MDMETDCRNRHMAKDVLRQEMDRLTKRIEQKFRPDAGKKSGLAGCRYIPKDEKYEQFLRDYQMLDVQGLHKALRTVVKDPSHLDAALLEMPKKLVCMISLLAKLGKYELTHAAVNLVLSEVKSVAEKLRFWSRTLDKILNQMSPKWNEIPANDLDKVLSISVLKRRKIGFSLPLSKKPHTIEEAFVIGVWPGLGLLYGREEKSLSQSQLSKIMMIAAQNDCWDLFKDCVQRGADFCQILKITVRSYHGKITKKHSALHYFLRDGFSAIELEKLPWPEGCPDVINYKDSENYTMLHCVILKPKDSSVDRDNVRFLLKRGADVNITGPRKQTVIQTLLSRFPKLTTIDTLLNVVENAGTIDQQTWKSNIPVLHPLCHYGKCHLLSLFTEKGADIYKLSEGKTLIDTLVNSHELHYDVKEENLAILLSSPFNLGPYHAGIVAKRSPVRNTFDPSPPYPVEYLLFPPMFTKAVEKYNLRLLKMLVDSGAVSDTELLAVQPLLPRAAQEGNGEAVQYMRLLTDALKPSSSQ